MADHQNNSAVRKPTGRRSIIYYLAALSLVSVVPSFVFAGILIQRNQAAQEATLETLIVSTSRSIVQAVEREIAANITTLRVLAASPSLRAGDFRNFYDRSKVALEETEANLFIINPDYSTFATTRLPFDSPPAVTNDKASAEKAFSGNDIVVTDLVFGAVSKRWVYNILLPVDLGPFGRKLIALNQQATNFASALTTNSLPEGWSAALVDNKGQVLAGSANAGSIGAQFAPFKVLDQPFGPNWQTIDTTTGKALGVVRRSIATGWRFVAWAPLETITQPLTNALLSLIAGGVMLLGLIVAALYWVSRLIVGSVRGLARDARRLGAGEPVIAKRYPVSEIADVSDALAQASLDRQAAENDVRFLMREVAHRSKNQMTVIAAMAKQTARGASNVAEYVDSFERRIMGLARSTDLLLTHGRAGVSLGELVHSQIAPFCPPDPSRVSIDGPEIRLNTQSAQILGMAIHELSTNAVKYGAFDGDTGKLSLRWTQKADVLELVWRETVDHPLPPSDRVGFGTSVLKTMVGRALNSKVESIYHEDGIEWRFAIPMSAIDPVQLTDADEDLVAE